MAGTPHPRPGDGSPPQLGLRRVRWVRVVLGTCGPRCQVVGTAFRRPVVREVPLRTAAALLAGGVPGVVRSPASAVPGGGLPPVVERAR